MGDISRALFREKDKNVFLNRSLKENFLGQHFALLLETLRGTCLIVQQECYTFFHAST